MKLVFALLYVLSFKAVAQDFQKYYNIRMTYGVDSAQSLFVDEVAVLSDITDPKIRIEKSTRYLDILDYLSQEWQKVVDNKYIDKHDKDGIKNDYVDYMLKDGISLLYYIRSTAKYSVADYYGCIADYEKLSKNSAKRPDSEATFFAGLAHLNLRHKEQGCLLLSASGEDGYSNAFEAIKQFCR